MKWKPARRLGWITLSMLSATVLLASDALATGDGDLETPDDPTPAVSVYSVIPPGFPTLVDPGQTNDQIESVAAGVVGLVPGMSLQAVEDSLDGLINPSLNLGPFSCTLTTFNPVQDKDTVVSKEKVTCSKKLALISAEPCVQRRVAGSFQNEKCHAVATKNASTITVTARAICSRGTWKYRTRGYFSAVDYDGTTIGTVQNTQPPYPEFTC